MGQEKTKEGCENPWLSMLSKSSVLPLLQSLRGRGIQYHFQHSLQMWRGLTSRIGTDKYNDITIGWSKKAVRKWFCAVLSTSPKIVTIFNIMINLPKQIHLDAFGYNYTHFFKKRFSFTNLHYNQFFWRKKERIFQHHPWYQLWYISPLGIDHQQCKRLSLHPKDGQCNGQRQNHAQDAG